MYSKIIAAVVVAAVFGAPAMAAQTISHSHSDCTTGKCGSPHGKVIATSHGDAKKPPPK